MQGQGASSHRHTEVQVVSLAGELLSKAVGLLQEGLTTTEVADGYEMAGAKV